MADQPLSISDIMFRCGVSYNTVKRVVYGNPRIRQEEGYPATFTATKPDAFDPNVIMIKYDKPQEGWITWLDEIRPLLVSITALSDTMGKEEREKKANMFKSLGRSFLSLGKDSGRVLAINRVMNAYKRAAFVQLAKDNPQLEREFKAVRQAARDRSRARRNPSPTLID